MKKKFKKELIEEMGMKFDEALELFSEETLASMSMVSIVGGDGSNTYCSGAQCISGCNNYCGSSCGTGSGTGGTTNGSGNTNSNGNGNNAQVFCRSIV